MKAEGMPEAFRSISVRAAVVAAVITMLVYLPALDNGFVNWDDDIYVYENVHIRSLDAHFFRWMFLDFYASNWHPLTWLSHAVDFALWGFDPRGHHAASVILHGLNTMFVVMVIARLLDHVGKAASPGKGPGVRYSDGWNYVAAGLTGILFGVHPLHVESVAWISERKDLLCSFFFLLSILSYIKYIAVHGAGGRKTPASLWPPERHYLYSLCLFAFSLLGKPMSLTLPAVLLILDWYPFERMEKGSARSLILEKIPFFALSLASVGITIMAQRAGGAISSLTLVPLPARIMTGLHALAAYIGKMVWPVRLLPLYPYQQVTSIESFISSGMFFSIAVTTAITIFSILTMKRRRIWLAVWCYYCVTLLPVLGFVQVGRQSMADRYTYLPSIGLFFLPAMGSVLFLNKYNFPGRAGLRVRGGYIIAVTILTGALTVSTVRQIQIWRNSLTLWNHEIALRPEVAQSYRNRGDFYAGKQLYEEALKDYTKAVKLEPEMAQAYNQRGIINVRLGRIESALDDFSRAIRADTNPDYSYFNNRGIAYSKAGRLGNAIEDYTEAIRRDPSHPEPYKNRAVASLKSGRPEEAEKDFKQAELLMRR